MNRDTKMFFLSTLMAKHHVAMTTHLLHLFMLIIAQLKQKGVHWMFN